MARTRTGRDFQRLKSEPVLMGFPTFPSSVNIKSPRALAAQVPVSVPTSFLSTDHHRPPTDHFFTVQLVHDYPKTLHRKCIFECSRVFLLLLNHVWLISDCNKAFLKIPYEFVHTTCKTPYMYTCNEHTY